jgi:hypothetical protein
MTATENVVPLAVAAQRLRRTWHQAWRLVLCGELAGEQRNGRWYVDAEALAQMEQEQEEKRAANRAA